MGLYKGLIPLSMAKLLNLNYSLTGISRPIIAIGREKVMAQRPFKGPLKKLIDHAKKEIEKL